MTKYNDSSTSYNSLLNDLTNYICQNCMVKSFNTFYYKGESALNPPPASRISGSDCQLMRTNCKLAVGVARC